MSETALVLDEVLSAAGPRQGRCDRLAGTPVPGTLVPVASITGTVARPGEFDRGFRPLTRRAGRHAEQIARLQAAGVPLPPVRLVRVGGLYFVEDGHHRVAAAVAVGRTTVAAAIRPACTVAAVPGGLRRTDLARLAAEREFLRAVPLPDAATVALSRIPRVDHAELARRARRWCGGRVTPTAAAAWWAAEMQAG
jgi:hypothetical protein